MKTPEPAFENEEAFREAVVEECRRILEMAGASYILLKDFGLDVAVWFMRETSVKVKFLELKVFTGARRGGISFGGGDGTGSQVDLLMQEPPKLALLERSVRWVFGDATLSSGDARFIIMPSEMAKAFAMNGVSRGKQNNFRIKELRRYAVDWPTFCERLSQFLLG